MIRGIEVNHETLGFAAVMNAVTGEGHFLGGGHTLGAMQKEYFYPKLADRVNHQKPGSCRVSEYSTESPFMSCRDTSTAHYLGSAVDRKIRDRFRVLLDV